MSMNAVFVQVEEEQLSRLQIEPDLAESFFVDDGPDLQRLGALTEVMQERVKAAGPQLMAQALSRLDPTLRKQIEDSIGRTTEALAGGAGADAILKLMKGRATGSAAPAAPKGVLRTLSLDKDWHGVHFVLCGEAEPGSSLLSQAVLGGVALGEDDEGFSGYGPARYFAPAQVVELAALLGRPELEAEAAARFDAARMSELQIYPGWRPEDAEAVMDALRRLRAFYADAAGSGRAIVTCLV